MTKADFYAGKQLSSVEWYLSHCCLPKLTWARLRVFSDGTADACWEDGGILYGFDEQLYAGYFLGEDEYVRLAGMDAEDELEHGIPFSKLCIPMWTDPAEQAFTYIGTY